VRSSPLVGCQRATTRITPTGRRDRSAVSLAGFAGLTLDPWQEEILTDSARTEGGKWSAFENVIMAPRQNGKSHLVVARALAGALLYEERLTLYSAHEYKTAQEVWRTMRDLCEESEVIAPHVKRISRWQGAETVEFKNGCRFKLIARTRSSGRGFSPDCLLLDEAFSISADVMASLLPSLSARPNPQVYYFSTAGTWESHVLLDLRRRGHSGAASKLGYWEWHAHPDVDVHDRRVWAATNPAYNVRIMEAAVMRELESMSRRSFLRERLGVWSESVAETVLDAERVHALIVDVPAPPTDGRRIGWGVDVAGLDRSSASIAAAFVGDDGVPVLVLIDTRGGAGWLPSRLSELDGAYGIDGIAYDQHGGIRDLMERVERDRDIASTPLRHAEYPSACAALVQRINDGTVHLANAPALITDATGAVARSLTGGWVWDRRTVTPPTNLIAATCALYALEHGDGSDAVAIY
jgi:hypothetical protein